MSQFKDPFGNILSFSENNEEIEKIKNLIYLRVEFSKKYAKNKGWSFDNLTMEQIIEIRNQEEWRNPQLTHP